VNEIANIISSELGLGPELVHVGGKTGWAGDIPRFMLDISKIKSLGWKPKISTEEGIRNYVRYLQEKS
jgi:UDP-glucose 4-epimerase